MSVVGILGNGEIGSSLHRVYQLAGDADVIVRDPIQGLDASLSHCGVVNVCIPFRNYDEFVTALRDLALREGCVVIIQSTVAVGCTDRVQADLPTLVCAQSPVRGVHPHLTDGLLTFDKYVGVSDRFAGDDAIESFLTQHMKSLGMKPVVCRAKESELAKLISTTLYGVNIAAITDVSKLCDDAGVDFEKVFTQWQTGYNAGYTALGKSNVCRPVLTPIPENEEDGKQVIGGHCILSNCCILEREMEETTLSSFVLRYSDERHPRHRAQSL
ncbi:unnamed protein product [Ectocarpus sp. 6 AP-2014]|uniref:UDP-glucose/GDP-mannose dehydrogenase n=1 Tax=Ectocarpus siliculosus TaxID=2880 RepID=D8LPB4_ECTSI|nr:UDP-glucose/GDP-mannose dehydrogenase [Ectocarpus siliculosus]|eukprot:CBN80385.1 UDP-glucose/GDP-mannose dehydrogenase [Ectocarpus siliculosus]